MTKSTIIKTVSTTVATAAYAAIFFALFTTTTTFGKVMVIVGGLATAAAVLIISHLIAAHFFPTFTEKELQELRMNQVEANRKARDAFWDGQEGFDKDEPDNPYADDIMTIEQARELGLESLYIKHCRPVENAIATA